MTHVTQHAPEGKSHFNFFDGAYNNPEYAQAVVALGMAQEVSILNKLNQTFQKEQAALNTQAINEGFSGATSTQLSGVAQGLSFGAVGLGPLSDGLGAGADLKELSDLQKETDSKLGQKDGLIAELDHHIDIANNPEAPSLAFEENAPRDLDGNVDNLKRRREKLLREREDIQNSHDMERKKIDTKSGTRFSTTKTFSNAAQGSAYLGQATQQANSQRAQASENLAKNMESSTSSTKQSLNQAYDKLLQVDPNSVLLGIARA